MRPFKTGFASEFLKNYQGGVLRYAYRGVPCLKSPIDIAIYMRMIWDLKPQTIIEIGSKSGGSALMFSDFVNAFGLDTKIYSIDLQPPDLEAGERVQFIEGDVLDLGTVFAKHQLHGAPRPWLVTEDSAHTYEGCLAALEFLAGSMNTGDMLVMEDGNLVELGLSERYNGGPNRAIAEFFQENPAVFEVVEEYCDMFGPNVTYCPNGYLRRK